MSCTKNGGVGAYDLQERDDLHEEAVERHDDTSRR
jgi:hypothetical protein